MVVAAEFAGISTAVGRGRQPGLLDAAGRHQHRPMTGMLHSPASHHRQERLVFALGIVTGCYNGELLENVER